MKKIKSILVCGYFGYGSLGDEIILSGMKTSLLQKHPYWRIVILSHYPDVVKKLHSLPAVCDFPTGIKTFISWALRGRFWDTLKEVMKADVFILGGGGFLSDLNWSNIPTWLMKVIYAKLFCLPVMSYALGVGPITKRSAKIMVRIIFNQFNLITVRDEESKRCLENAGVKRKIIVTVDPGVFVEPNINVQLKNESGEPITGASTKYKIGLAPAAMFYSEKLWPGKTERYFELIRDFATLSDFIIERLNAEVFLFQVSPNVDSDMCQKIQQSMRNRAHILFPHYNHLEIAGVFAQMDMIVGMRFHSIVLSVAVGVPFVAIIYHHKTKCFLEQINQLHRSVPLEFRLEDLVHNVVDVWDKKEEMRNELVAVMPRLKERAYIPSILASRFLND
ncbi:hypothetical protein AC481_05525 [miscellaneous Crenarchaeota group archaeon SMTZ-80]|nr:MAG: hypothetical protein AC481_05525 [miscellaneous Crenarchaeota group archaeon SMTZ-80]